MSTDNTSTSAPNEGEGMRQMRERLEQLEQENKEKTAAATALAFLRAGVPEDEGDQLAKLFRAANAGLTDPDEIKAAWTSLQEQVKPSSPIEELPAPTNEAPIRDLLNRNTVPPAGLENEDPYSVGMREFNAALAEGRPRADAAASFLDTLVAAAVDGDRRVIYDQNTYQSGSR